MIGALGKSCERIQERLPAALRGVCVILDKRLVMWLVGKATTNQRDVVAAGKGLPKSIAHIGPSVRVRARHEDEDRAQESGIIRVP
jgi:hypothetical protein